MRCTGHWHDIRGILAGTCPFSRPLLFHDRVTRCILDTTFLGLDLEWNKRAGGHSGHPTDHWLRCSTCTACAATPAGHRRAIYKPWSQWARGAHTLWCACGGCNEPTRTNCPQARDTTACCTSTARPSVSTKTGGNGWVLGAMHDSSMHNHHLSCARRWQRSPPCNGE